jgi:hypothetical protein
MVEGSVTADDCVGKRIGDNPLATSLLVVDHFGSFD